MARMLYLGDVLELVNNRLDDGALAGQKLVVQAHQVILHIATGLSEKLDAPRRAQLSCQRFKNIASIRKDLAEQIR